MAVSSIRGAFRLAESESSPLRRRAERRLGKIRGRRLQDLARALELTILALQLLQALPLVRVETSPLALIAFVLPHPPAQRLGSDEAGTIHQGHRAPAVLRQSDGALIIRCTAASAGPHFQ